MTSSPRKRWVLLAAVVLFTMAFGIWLKFFPAPNAKTPYSQITVEEKVSQRRSESSSSNASATAAQRSKLQQIRDAVDGDNVPVDFWGKIVDQDNSPLPSVRIRASVRHWRPGKAVTGSRFIPKQAVSDENGRFEIHGDTGDILTIEALEKEGYEPEPFALRSFGYNISTNITPDPTNPVVLRMWKADVKGELISGDKFFAIIPDGRVYTIDLLDGMITESSDANGDLRVSVLRPENATYGQRYDWSFTIEPISGGILEERDLYASMYLAPLEGYEPKFKMTREASQQTWGHRAKRRFYVKTRGGQVFGRIAVDVFAFYDLQRRDGTFGIKYAVNPTGSRVLR